jgi:serine/threonine-protein kinase
LRDETGRDEVYVRPFPGAGGHIRVSINFGVEPVWSSDSRELFYRSATHVMAAQVSGNPQLDIVKRDTLFADVYRTSAPQQGRQNYEVFPNGREFVFVQASRTGERQLIGIARWTEQLLRR